MAEKKVFRIITASNIESLEWEINSLLKSGYSLHGWMFQSADWLICQAVVDSSLTVLKISEIGEIKDIKNCKMSWAVAVSWTITVR